MVRRGLRFRVPRKRACKSAAQALFVSDYLRILERGAGMEPLMEPSGRERDLRRVPSRFDPVRRSPASPSHTTGMGARASTTPHPLLGEVVAPGSGRRSAPADEQARRTGRSGRSRPLAVARTSGTTTPSTRKASGTSFTGTSSSDRRRRGSRSRTICHPVRGLVELSRVHAPRMLRLAGRSPSARAHRREPHRQRPRRRQRRGGRPRSVPPRRAC